MVLISRKHGARFVALLLEIFFVEKITHGCYPLENWSKHGGLRRLMLASTTENAMCFLRLFVVASLLLR
jgi:hypothetical protein